MFGVLFLAMLIDLAIASAVAGGLALLRRSGADMPIRPLWAAGLLFLVLLFPLLDLVSSSTVMRGENLSVNQYRGTGPELPAEASGISYNNNFQGTDAVFSVSEAAFLNWTSDNNWRTTRLTAPESVDIHQLGIETTVENGLAVSETFHPRGTGVSMTYDTDSGRCYYRYSSY
jgi:hypothetical protein